MATPIIPHRKTVPTPMGRPSNLGAWFAPKANLPANMFETNPIPLRGLSNKIVKVSDYIPARAKDPISFRQRFMKQITALGMRWG